MTTPVTSPEALPAGPSRLTDQWKAFFAFLKKPQLPERASGFGAAPLVATGRMLVLDLLVTLGVLCVFFLLTLIGLELPENALADLDLDLAAIALIVLGAPLMEEILFRGWLSGRPGHVVAILLVLVAMIGAGIVSAVTGSPAPAVIAVCLGAGLLLALIAIWVWRKSGPWRWFAKIFPVLLPVSALLFASMHLFNYEEGMSALLLMLVVPQFLSGLIFGYARVNYGLWSSMLLHALHNGTAIAVILMFPQAA